MQMRYRPCAGRLLLFLLIPLTNALVLCIAWRCVVTPRCRAPNRWQPARAVFRKVRYWAHKLLSLRTYCGIAGFLPH